MSTVVLYCWCHSASASVPLYFTSLTGLVTRNTHEKYERPTTKLIVLVFLSIDYDNEADDDAGALATVLRTFCPGGLRTKVVER